MKADYLKIRKFLLRMTHGENFREEEKWKTFKNISFYDFLSEVGMFQSGEDVQDHKCQLKAKQRYCVYLIIYGNLNTWKAFVCMILKIIY